MTDGQGRFVAGVSGNPVGRPRATSEGHERVRAIAPEPVVTGPDAASLI